LTIVEYNKNNVTKLTINAGKIYWHFYGENKRKDKLCPDPFHFNLLKTLALFFTLTKTHNISLFENTK